MRVEFRNGEPLHNRHIAVVGAGISGLSAAWLLSQRHRVTLFEAEPRAGGHSHTVMAPTGSGETPVDTGFIVYNERNYPNLTALFTHLGVTTKPSSMSFSASLHGGRLEYSSDGLRGLLGQKGNAVSPRFWRMLGDIGRFYVEAPRVLHKAPRSTVTLGEYLDAGGYTDAFVNDHLLPMGAAIWSTTARQMREYPLVAFVRFFVHHGLLDVLDRPKWRTVAGGSRRYVERLVAGIGDVRLGRKVAQVLRHGAGATVIDQAGGRQHFDGVVIATHADQALRLLGDADGLERALLGSFRYTDNTAVLHTDAALMPLRQRVWASWNYVGGHAEAEREAPLCVTYWMNRLQGLDPAHPLFVTLNPIRDIAPERTIRRLSYRHPLFDAGAIDAQQQLWRLQGMRRTWFAGSYFGQGFHEDALQAGLAAAEDAGGVSRPWSVAGMGSRIAEAPLLEAAE